MVLARDQHVADSRLGQEAVDGERPWVVFAVTVERPWIVVTVEDQQPGQVAGKPGHEALNTMLPGGRFFDQATEVGDRAVEHAQRRGDALGQLRLAGPLVAPSGFVLVKDASQGVASADGQRVGCLCVE